MHGLSRTERRHRAISAETTTGALALVLLVSRAGALQCFANKAA